MFNVRSMIKSFLFFSLLFSLAKEARISHVPNTAGDPTPDRCSLMIIITIALQKRLTVSFYDIVVQ